MPNLGIIASSNQQGRSAFDPSSYFSLATTTVGAGGVSSVTFSNIPTGYKHLQIRFIARNTANVGGDIIQMRINGDTSGNYINHFLYGLGSGTGTSGTPGVGSTYSWLTYNSADASYSSNIFAGGIVDILDYSNVNKNKTIRSLAGSDGNGSGYVSFQSSAWLSTAAITSLTLYCFNLGSNNLAQFSSFALYGVK